MKVNITSIIRVEDLITFFSDIRMSENLSAKKNTIIKIAIFNEIHTNYKIQENITEGFDIIKYRKVIQKRGNRKKQKQEQAVLLSVSKIKNIPELIDLLDDDYVGINIFAKNEKK